jgi:hypothetical protein
MGQRLLNPMFKKRQLSYSKRLTWCIIKVENDQGGKIIVLKKTS